MPVPVANDIAHWRAQIFARLLLVVFLLGLFTAVPSVLLAVSEGMWSIAVVDSEILKTMMKGMKKKNRSQR